MQISFVSNDMEFRYQLKNINPVFLGIFPVLQIQVFIL